MQQTLTNFNSNIMNYMNVNGTLMYNNKLILYSYF